MNPRKIVTIALLVLMCASCTTPGPTYPIREKKYVGELVSVQSAVNMALAAYLRGCVESGKGTGRDRLFDDCAERARKYVRDDIVFILDQEPAAPLNNNN